MTDYLGNPIIVRGTAPINVFGNPVRVYGFAPLLVTGNPVNVTAPKIWFVRVTVGGLKPVVLARGEAGVRQITPSP